MKGIRSLPSGKRQAYVTINGRFRSKTYPAGTGDLILRRWREEQRVRARLGAVLPPEDEPFEIDAAAYVASVESMPSIKDRRLHMADWARTFAGRHRNTIQAIEIKSELERLRRAGLKGPTCNKRRTALMSFYTALNGKSGYNPVRDVAKYDDSEAEPRAQPIYTLYRILALIRRGCRTRHHLRVELATGWPAAQVRKLKPEHLKLQEARCYVTRRRKGKGKAGAWLPLLPRAVAALTAFDKARAYGDLSTSAKYKSFRLALGKLNARRERFGHPPLSIRPYDLRHSFGTMIAKIITDDRAIQELMLHSRPEQQRRYTESATAARVDAAISAVKLAQSLHGLAK